MNTNQQESTKSNEDKKNFVDRQIQQLKVSELVSVTETQITKKVDTSNLDGETGAV